MLEAPAATAATARLRSPSATVHSPRDVRVQALLSNPASLDPPPHPASLGFRGRRGMGQVDRWAGS